MVDRLWGLKKDHTEFVMNIFCNLALELDVRKVLETYAHQIILSMKYDKKDMILEFVLNWFIAQNFEIRTSF